MARRIFISDIHMGIREGQSGPHPYGWLREDRQKLLAEFLNSLTGSNAVDELIIVGDLFDEWVMPFQVSSPAGDDESWFAKVAADPLNAAILKALSDLAGRSSVSYVHGNHDMQLSQSVLAGLAPGVKWVSGDPGMGVYAEDGIHAEHGSLYCLFNAPYLLSGKQLQQVPLGYLMARSNAQFVSEGGTMRWEEYLQLFLDVFLDLFKGDKLAEAFIEAMVKAMKINPDTPVYLYGVDGFTSQATTIKAMATQLGDIYDQWDDEWKNQGIDNVPRDWAVLGDAGCLYHAAELHFTSQNKLVIYGHTHKWELDGVLSSDLSSVDKEMADLLDSKITGQETLNKMRDIADKYDPGEGIYDGHVYVNCGTWIDGTGDSDSLLPATYVEVCDHGGERRVTVYQCQLAPKPRPGEPDKLVITALKSRTIRYP